MALAHSKSISGQAHWLQKNKIKRFHFETISGSSIRLIKFLDPPPLITVPLFCIRVSLMAWVTTRVTRWVCEKMWPNTFFLSKLLHNLNRRTMEPKNVGSFSNFQKTAQSKQSLFGRKFAQSGHPGNNNTFRPFRLHSFLVTAVMFQARHRSFLLILVNVAYLLSKHQGWQMVYFFIPKMPIMVYFGRTFLKKVISWQSGIYSDIFLVLWPFWYIFPV
jgi:hypothetical protein